MPSHLRMRNSKEGIFLMRQLLRALAVGGCLLAGIALTSAPAVAGGFDFGARNASWAVSYSGIDFAQDSHYSYSGILISTQRDLSKSGIMLHGFVGYGAYDYSQPSLPGGKVDGDIVQLSGLIGYMFVRQGGSVGIYVGVDYQDHDLSPADPSNQISGDEVGFKVAGDIRHTTNRHYLTLEGSYSTAFDSYWSRARAGLTFDRITFGPEGLALGNASFDAQRIGGFLLVRHQLTPRLPVELTLSGGYQFLDDSVGSSSFAGGEGAYGAVNFSIVY